jgi:lipopolysaccharide/colanic/teichoic acid biosynthesis glycosyltransferase
VTTAQRQAPAFFLGSHVDHKVRKREVSKTVTIPPLRLLNRGNGNQHAQTSVPVKSYGILSEEIFARTLYVERKRTERSGRSFVLMLLESAMLLKPDGDQQALERVLLALSRSTRDTDTTGWHKEGSTLGVIFTELGADMDGRSVANALLNKVTNALTGTLTIGQINEVRLTFHAFPEKWDKHIPADDKTLSIYDDLLFDTAPKRLSLAAKRLMDIVGSSLALLIGLPLFIAIAIAVKLTSKGPVLFHQQRLGQYGKRFNFLKYRSMSVNNDSTIHQEYVKSFIANAHGSSHTAEGPATYKIAADPRVTPLGRFLRKTSLDELPQFVNVLKGDMSLVGPRPPVTYEAECYHVWHRTRLLAAKPGLTGLWQVAGRSRVKFDDMVRMDLRYATSWSLWLDIKILLRTPLAVVSGNGAH